ncbi:SIMPL domain-containing protein [Chryseobacterium sp. RG1]|uniref:SIMPL domain-containing protein n=1 Tax=Chryseobacterium tagetis TaxID=2801334 RepID=A0ABS8A4J6_9FLAO|nr:SIMPL domain-containing protein [Chryseobacterium tagetis]MCA6068357.1 SIMPL domain-containing protein [Chryseobacterium tagetis]
MKLTHFLLIGFFTLASFANAQEVKKNAIEVTGVAEMEVEPDEIIFSIGIKGDNKNDLATNEKKLFEILKSSGVKNEDIKFKSMYQNMYFKKTFTKSFQFKVNKATDMGNLFENLNQKWVSNISIAEIKNTKIADFRKTVKINALKAAKEKADYLLESINKKTGAPLEIVEIEDYTSDTVIPAAYKAARVSNIQLEAADTGIDYSFENIDNIKLKYSIKTKYEIL